MKQAKLNNGFSPELLGRIKSAIRRTGAEIWDNAEASRYLERRGAKAAYIADGKGTGTFAFRENPTRSDVFEELIHQAQDRRGEIRLGDPAHEIAAAEKLIRNRKAYRIPNSETRETIRRLRYLRRG